MTTDEKRLLEKMLPIMCRGYRDYIEEKIGMHCDMKENRPADNEYRTRARIEEGYFNACLDVIAVFTGSAREAQKVWMDALERYGKIDPRILTDREFKETLQKTRVLVNFGRALAVAGKHVELHLIDDDTVEVIDLNSKATRRVNIACDNATAMMYDIFRQAGDWIL
jgi:hypothetical protein